MIERMVRSQQMSDGHEPEAIIYPSAPLRAVAIEVSFRPLLDAMSRFGVFQRRHSKDLSRVHETPDDRRIGSREGREFARPRSAVLIARDGERAVSIANDQLAVITYLYSAGFAGFSAWALPMLREGLNDLGVERINEVGYRYENRIQRETRDLDLGTILKVSLAAPGGASSTTSHLHMYWHQKWPEGVVEVELEACPNVSEHEIHLNITSYVATQDGDLNSMEATARTARRLARLTFEDLITPEFRTHLQSSDHLRSSSS